MLTLAGWEIEVIKASSRPCRLLRGDSDWLPTVWRSDHSTRPTAVVTRPGKPFREVAKVEKLHPLVFAAQILAPTNLA